MSGAPDVPIAINSGILVLASQDATLTKSQLTDEEFDFYKSLYGCAADTTRAQCTKFDSIAVTKGLKLEAGVELPESVEADAAKIGIPATGNLLISGQIPIFGGTTFSLTVELGNFRFDKQPDWFDHGAVSLTISTSGLKFSGDLGMRIRRQGGGYDETNCPDGSVLPIVWNDDTQGSACYDKLDFVISVTIDYSNPAEPGIELAGVLQTNGGWHHAFGQSWLTINHVALELGVKMTPTGPEVTLGFQGDIQVGSKDIEAAVKVGLATLQVPPFVRPDLIGFSLASSSGVALSDVVEMQKAVSGGATLLDTSSLPDVSIRNFFFQFSTENDSNLCLTQGLRFNGDLYVGSNLPTPDPPSVDGTGCRNFNADPNSPSTSCIAHKANGCLASIGATIDDSGIRAKGELSGFTLGPLEMKDSSFHLNLTATEQSLFMSGGVKIASTSYTFAEGTATLDFSKDGFFFTGDAAVFNGAFHAYIQTSAPFDFTNPSFTLKVWLRADVNAAIQGALSQGLQAVKPILVGISQIVALFGRDGAAGILQNLPTTLASAGVTVPPDIQKIVNGIADVGKQINDFGHATGFSLTFGGLLEGFKLPDFPGLQSTYVPSSRTCLFVVENGTCYTTPPWHTAFGDCCGVPGTWVDPVCVGTVVISGVCWAVPPITGPTIPGLCSLIGISSSSADCSWGGLLGKYVLAPLVQKFNQTTGLNLPTTFSELQTQINNLVDSINVPNVDILSLDCAEFSLDASLAAQGHVNVSLASKLRVFGHQLEFGFGWNFANFNGNAGDVVKQVIQQLLNPHTTTCDPIPPGHAEPGASQTISGSLSSTKVNEGGTATWTGTFGNTAANYPAVTVDWGDGTSETIAAGTSKTVSKTHTYPQNGPHGFSHGQYTVAGMVNDTGGNTASSTEGVDNVAPSITTLTAAPGPATEDGVVTLERRLHGSGRQRFARPEGQLGRRQCRAGLQPGRRSQIVLEDAQVPGQPQRRLDVHDHHRGRRRRHRRRHPDEYDDGEQRPAVRLRARRDVGDDDQRGLIRRLHADVRRPRHPRHPQGDRRLGRHDRRHDPGSRRRRPDDDPSPAQVRRQRHLRREGDRRRQGRWEHDADAPDPRDECQPDGELRLRPGERRRGQGCDVRLQRRRSGCARLPGRLGGLGRRKAFGDPPPTCRRKGRSSSRTSTSTTTPRRRRRTSIPSRSRLPTRTWESAPPISRQWSRTWLRPLRFRSTRRASTRTTWSSSPERSRIRASRTRTPSSSTGAPAARRRIGSPRSRWPPISGASSGRRRTATTGASRST